MVAAAMGLAVAVRLAYAYLTRGHALAGDEIEYDFAGRAITQGHWFWGLAPYGVPHPSLFKAPGYPLWVGVWYSLVGPHADRVLAVQALVGPVNVALTWLLARRLFEPRVAVLAAGLIAVYPLAWVFEERLFPEVLATPLTLLAFLIYLERPATARRAAAVGAVIGAGLLVRPTAFFLYGGVAAGWWVQRGLRRAACLLGIALVVSALVIAPWAYRNHRVSGGFVALSIQDAAIYGTFNPTSAGDSRLPYAWRPEVPRDLDLFRHRPRLPELELRRRLIERSSDYIAEHPGSLIGAFFWNGLSRTWDLQPLSRAVSLRSRGIGEAAFTAGVLAYWAVLPLAAIGLWRIRRRRDLVLSVLGTFAAASIVFTVAAATRYRAPLEPLIVILASSAIVGLAPRLRRARAASPSR